MKTRIGGALVFAFGWAFAVAVAVHTLDFPGSVPNFHEVSGGQDLLDTAPAFTPDAIYERLASYGDAGRRNYAFRNLTVDVVLPVSILPFLFLLNYRAAASRSLGGLRRISLLTLPFAYVIFDLVENSAVLGLLASYPERLNLLASALPVATMIKRSALLLALVAPLAMLAFRRRRAG